MRLSKRDGTITGAQKRFLRILVNEAFAAGYPGYPFDASRPGALYLPDRNHLGRLSMAEASEAISMLRRAKAAGWVNPTDAGRLANLMDALAEHAAETPDQALLDDAAAAGVDVKVEADRVRDVLADAVNARGANSLDDDDHIRDCGNGGSDPSDCSPACVKARARCADIISAKIKALNAAGIDWRGDVGHTDHDGIKRCDCSQCCAQFPARELV